jgi:predicted esterase
VPIAAFHGEADRGVPYEQSRLAAEHLLGLGFPLTLQSYAGLGHTMSRELIADWDEVLATKLAAAIVPPKSLAEAH